MAKPLTASMLNEHASTLGYIASAAGHDGLPGVGDTIDRGLILLRMLNEAGYDVTQVREPTKPVLEIVAFEVTDTYWGRIALHCHYAGGDAHRMLILKGWTPPSDFKVEN